MKNLLICLVVALLAPTNMLLAADGPTGTWKVEFNFDGQSREQTLMLKTEGDRLTGTMTGRNNRAIPLENPTFKDGKVGFVVSGEANGQKLTRTYSGTLKGDTIIGKIEYDFNGQVQSVNGKPSGSRKRQAPLNHPFGYAETTSTAPQTPK